MIRRSPSRASLALVCLAGAALAWQAAAQNVLPRAAPTTAPDASRGATIVQNGTTAGAPPCQTCHGAAGDGSGTSPRLYGQSAAYLARQLHDFKSQSLRPSDIMSPVANALTDQQIADVAAYYASTSEAAPAPATADPAQIQRGQTLATLGDNAKSIPACNNCHGPAGAGEPPQIPPLAEQFPQYITASLQAWRNGQRKVNAVQMGPIAKRLSDSDIAALSAYYAQLRPTAQASTPK